jgi:nucleotide-binding universal stress UspA family protein
MKTILVPVDFSALTGRLVTSAADLAKAIKAKVVLLHVVNFQLGAAVFDFEVESASALLAMMDRTADAKLAALGRGLARRGVAFRLLRLGGHPATVIVEQARRSGAAYVVIGSHGHTAFFDLLLGSTASAVLRRARCPVLVVPAARPLPRRAGRRR